MDDEERINRKNELLQIARRYVAHRQGETHVVGMVLYGSLAVGRLQDLTPFSDIDVATIVERDPPSHFTEHRLFQGADVDNLIFTVDTVAALVEKPEHLFQGGFLCYLTTALLAAGEDAILFDPTGKIAQMRAELREKTGYDRMARADLSSWIEGIHRDSLPRVEGALYNGADFEARNGLTEAVNFLCSILRLLTLNKCVEAASAQLGIPAFAGRRAEFQALLVPDTDAFEEYRADLERVEDLVQVGVYRRISEALRLSGTPDPERKEFVGDHELFRGGNRLIEFGRLTLETKASFDRSRFEQGRGDLLEALDLLRCSTPWEAKRRCQKLASVLCESGVDLHEPVEAFLKSPDFVAAVAAARRSGRALVESACRAGKGNGLEGALEICRAMVELLMPLTAPSPAA